jgi:hypothetical protein
MILKVLTLLIGIIAFLAFLKLPKVVENSFPEGIFKEVLVELLHESGLLIIATILFSATVGYIFFRGTIARFVTRRTDVFINQVIGSVDRGYEKVSESVARRLGTLDGELVLRWASEGHAPAEEYKSAALAAARQYYGSKLGYAVPYVDATIDQFLDEWMGKGYWREGMSIDIYLEKIEKPPNLAPRNLIRWEETQSFSVVCPTGRGVYKIPQEMGIEVRPDDLSHVLSKLELSLKATPAGQQASVEFKLSSVMSRIDLNTLMSGIACEEKIDEKRSVKLIFNRNYLNVNIETEVDLMTIETTITVKQVCVMRATDRQYSFVNALPTKGYVFSMRLGANMRDTVFSDVTVSSEYYHDRAARNVKNTKDEPDSFIRHLDGWFFPGSAIIVEWTDA